MWCGEFFESFGGVEASDFEEAVGEGADHVHVEHHDMVFEWCDGVLCVEA